MLLPIACGLIFAFWHSFADALAWRIYTAWYSARRKLIHQKVGFVLSARSCCEFCSKPVKWFALFPVIGFFLARGRCSNCERKISLRFPLQELCALLFGIAVGFKEPAAIDFTLLLIAYLLLWIVISIDYRVLLIPTEVILSLLCLGLISVFFRASTRDTLDWGLDLAVAFTWYFLFHLLRILSGYKMGLADVRLVLALGLLLGHPYAIHLPGVAAVYAIVFYLLRRNSILIYAPAEKEIPFGVFLSFGYLTLYFLR